MNRYKRFPTVPLIQLKGYWLNKAGFTVNTELSVHAKGHCITIKVKKSNE
ncbi:SymE family type I addiction module toxin [Sessilibacter corallicola]